MKECRQYVLSGLSLRVYPGSYLIEVCDIDRSTAQESDWLQVPEWIFRSNRAIWLTMESAPIMRRAQRGEMIRRQLMPLWIRRTGKCAGEV